jgi:acyl-CoA thioesterase I
MKRSSCVFSLLIGAVLLLNQACSSNTEQQQNDQPASATTSPAASASVSATAANGKKTILFYGNSLTAGYGLDPAQAFPALIGRRLDSLKMDYKVVNSGLSGETTAGGLSRINWVLRQPVDVFVLELGGNDGLRGLPLADTRKNLQAIIDTVRTKYPDCKIVLAGMQVPPNLGTDYTAEFKGIYGELARKNKLPLIPFLLDRVGGIPRLNLPDGIHPTAQGHRIVAETVWQTLKTVL